MKCSRCMSSNLKHLKVGSREGMVCITCGAWQESGGELPRTPLSTKDLQHKDLQTILAVIDQKILRVDEVLLTLNSSADKIILREIRDNMCRFTSEFIHMLETIEEGYYD